jgi:spermidine synthase
MMPTPIQNYAISTSLSAKRLTVLAALFFLSGTSGLIFQVVWMYRLGLVFGNAVYATAATLAAFFLGLALGGWLWGNTVARFRRPLSVYGLMELGVALTALLWIPGVDFYKTHYPSVVAVLGDHRSMLILAKFVFSTTLLFFPTVLMGGTFPVLAQYVGEGPRQLASRGTLLYAVNTLGASSGAFFAGFFLLSKYGVNSTYSIAVALAASTGIGAILLDRLSGRAAARGINPAPVKRKSTRSSVTIKGSLMIVLAFITGLLALSAETVWIRMFAQVLQNSVYSFSAILVVFLIALGFGGLLSHVLVRLSLPPIRVLLVLLYAGAIIVGLSPVVFNAATDGLGYVASRASWFEYLWAVFRLSILVVFPPTVIIGAVFPFLLKAAPVISRESGRFVGRLVLFNSLGSAVGPILAGFFILDSFGLWNSIKIIALAYGGLALFVASSAAVKRVTWMALPMAALIGLIGLSSPPIVRLQAGENIVKVWQASDGVVSVVKSADNLQMRLDNFYVLGDTRSALVEQMQAHIPLLLHPTPRRTLFLGMGTGITAGASLNHDVERVVAVELVPNVIRAAKRYFSPWVNGLFGDSQVEIIADDARNFLLGTTEQFDVIVGDLFTPWHAGTGSLYTVEHFQLAKKRLAPGGLFAQWLPLYQLTPESFETIAASFASVFPVVTLWRADFSGTRASIGLIGQETGSRLDQETLLQNIVHIVGERDTASNGTSNHMAGLFYLGNLEALQDRLSGIMLNTDDKRTVEFKAPILSQQANAGVETYIVGRELEKLLMTLATNLPADQDPYLADLPASEIRYVEVGLQYYRYLQLTEAGTKREADNLLGRIRALAPDFLKDRY